MKEPGAWAQLDLGGDPILVVGRRPKPKTLEAYVVDLHDETFETMRGIAQQTITALTTRLREDWHPNASIEPGEEYLAIEVENLPTPPAPRRGAAVDLGVDAAAQPRDPRLVDAAGLLRLVLAPGELDNLDSDQLAAGKFLFYALVWEQADAGRPIAFVSKYDPTTVLRKASAFFRFDGTLRSADPPDFALDDRADLVITIEEIAVLSPPAFDQLFADIRALLNDVPANVAALRAALTQLPMTDASRRAIEQICATRPSLARRLQNFASSPDAAAITPANLRAVLRRHGQHPNEFVRNGILDIQPAHVGALLDVAEGRWYEADFTSEPRRAASWSRR